MSGILIGPVTTLFYDSGFLIALKGFVGTVIAGMASFPLAVLGAIVVGVVESFSSFYASAFKEAIVFGLLIPFLLWRSAVEPRTTKRTGTTNDAASSASWHPGRGVCAGAVYAAHCAT